MPSDSSGSRPATKHVSDALATALAPFEVTNAATAATIRLPDTAAARARDSHPRSPSAPPVRRDGLMRAAVKFPAKLPMPAAAPMVPQHGQLNHPLASCALATNGGEEQETHHHLDRAVAPQTGDDVAANGCRRGPVTMTSVGWSSSQSHYRRVRGSSVWRAPRPGDLHPLGDPHHQRRTGQRDEHDDEQGAGSSSSVENNHLGAGCDAAAHDGYR